MMSRYKLNNYIELSFEGEKILSIKSTDGKIHLKLGQKIFSREIRHSIWRNNQLVTGWGLITKIYKPSANQQLADVGVLLWPENWFMADIVKIESLLNQEEILQQRVPV